MPRKMQVNDTAVLSRMSPEHKWKGLAYNMAGGYNVAGGLGGSFYKIPASDTPEGKERLRAYHESLGHFIATFSQTEARVFEVLRHYSGLDSDKAAIILTGVPLESKCAQTKQIVSLLFGSASSELAELDACYAQLGHIRAARNDIVHYGASLIAEGEGVVTRPKRGQKSDLTFPISPSSLDDMTADLKRINSLLAYRHLKRSEPRTERGLAVLRVALNAPWRYKHIVQQTDQRLQKRPPPTG